jgi:hypothetical protein
MGFEMQYLKVEEGSDWIVGAAGRPDPGPQPEPESFVGPIEPLQQPDEGFYLVAWQGTLNLSDPPSSTSRLKWDGQEPVWVETAPLADIIARVRDDIDARGEVLRLAVVSRRTLKADEYAQAEMQARAWRAAEYAGDPPEDVASWADARHREEMTAVQAAENILAQADMYRSILSGIRRLRLRHMEDARHAATPEEAAACGQAFAAELATLAAGIA